LNPAEILRLSKSAMNLAGQSGRSPEGFVVAYIAWEALKIRILLVGMTANGMSVSEAKKVVSTLEIWQGDKYNKAFKSYFGSFPNNTPGIGRLFNKADSFKSLRNGFVHGSRKTSPAKFREATIELVGIIEADWAKRLGSLLLNSKNADPMKRLQRQTTPRTIGKHS
jgi:hypothetical protein